MFSQLPPHGSDFADVCSAEFLSTRRIQWEYSRPQTVEKIDFQVPEATTDSKISRPPLARLSRVEDTKLGILNHVYGSTRGALRERYGGRSRDPKIKKIATKIASRPIKTYSACFYVTC